MARILLNVAIFSMATSSCVGKAQKLSPRPCQEACHPCVRLEHTRGYPRCQQWERTRTRAWHTCTPVNRRDTHTGKRTVTPRPKSKQSCPSTVHW